MICPSCTQEIPGEAQICMHHHMVGEDDFAKANKIMCDFFHRGVIPQRLSEAERADAAIVDVSGWG